MGIGVWFGEEDFLNSRIVAMREVADGAIKIRKSPKVESAAMFFRRLSLLRTLDIVYGVTFEETYSINVQLWCKNL